MKFALDDTVLHLNAREGKVVGIHLTHSDPTYTVRFGDDKGTEEVLEQHLSLPEIEVLRRQIVTMQAEINRLKNPILNVGGIYPHGHAQGHVIGLPR